MNRGPPVLHQTDTYLNQIICPTTDASQGLFPGHIKTRRQDWGLADFLIANGVVPNRFVDVDCLNSCRCCLENTLLSIAVRWLSNTVSGLIVTWRLFRSRRNQIYLSPQTLKKKVDILSSESIFVTDSTKLSHHIVVAVEKALDPRGNSHLSKKVNFKFDFNLTRRIQITLGLTLTLYFLPHLERQPEPLYPWAPAT